MKEPILNIDDIIAEAQRLMDEKNKDKIIELTEEQYQFLTKLREQGWIWADIPQFWNKLYQPKGRSWLQQKHKEHTIKKPAI